MGTACCFKKPKDPVIESPERVQIPVNKNSMESLQNVTHQVKVKGKKESDKTHAHPVDPSISKKASDAQMDTILRKSLVEQQHLNGESNKKKSDAQSLYQSNISSKKPLPGLIQEYKIGDLISREGKVEVHQCLDNVTGSTFAMKFVNVLFNYPVIRGRHDTR